jgi:hypothetical protein
MRAAFTEKELKAVDAAFMKLVLQKIEFATTLPLSVVCGNPATPWYVGTFAHQYKSSHTGPTMQVPSVPAAIEMGNAVVVRTQIQRSLGVWSVGLVWKSTGVG